METFCLSWPICPILRYNMRGNNPHDLQVDGTSHLLKKTIVRGGGPQFSSHSLSTKTFRWPESCLSASDIENTQCPQLHMSEEIPGGEQFFLGTPLAYTRIIGQQQSETI